MNLISLLVLITHLLSLTLSQPISKDMQSNLVARINGIYAPKTLVSTNVVSERQMGFSGAVVCELECIWSKDGHDNNDVHDDDKELPSKDEIIGLASIVVPPTDPLEQYLLDHENDMHMHERYEIDKISLNNNLYLNTIFLLKL